MKRKTGLLAAAVLCCAAVTGCSSIPANTVFSADDLEGKIIACQIGTTGYTYARDITDTMVYGYNKGEEAVQALVLGQADAVIIDSEPAKVFVAENDSLMILNEPFAEEDYAIAYKHNNAELGEQLDAVLTELKNDGTMEEIITHWIGDDADHMPYTPDTSVTRDGTLTMATNAEFPPYESWKENEIVGIDVDIMQAVCDRLGKKLVTLDMDFDAIIPAVDSGKADVGVAGITITEERKEQVSFTQSYASATQVIIVRK